MRRAAARGHRVLFVETGGFLGRHVVRLLRGPSRRSLVRRLLHGEAVETGVVVRKALNVVPWGQKFSISNNVNGWVSRRTLRRTVDGLPAPRVTWLYDPRATWAIGRVADVFGVYDCVDDYAEQAAGERNRALVAAADRRAARTARLVFTTTNALYERHRRTNAHTNLVGNAADFDHFSAAVDRALAPARLARLPRPVLGFVGNIAENKVDFCLLRRLADADGSRTILLAGPADAASKDEFVQLAKRPNVVWIGPVSYARVPRVVAAFDVALIPYAENAYTRNVFPLKLYEYLAAGKPVVASGLPELGGLEPDVVVARGREVFESAVAAALSLTSEADVVRRQSLAAANTWDARAGRLIDLVAQELEAVQPSNGIEGRMPCLRGSDSGSCEEPGRYS
jgi:glycosyltransferase involved in cell wall biosynthesis